MSNILEELKLAIVEGDDEVAPEKAEAALAAGLAPVDVMQQAIVAGIEEAGRLWSENKYFLPDVILSAGAFKAAAAVIQPKLAAGSGPKAGKILLGVVAGDMHDLGKTIVIAMLAGGGFEVIDLGVDVPVQTFVEKVRELKPDIVGLGAYMTTTMLLMKDVIDGSDRPPGLRDRSKSWWAAYPPHSSSRTTSARMPGARMRWMQSPRRNSCSVEEN